MLFWSFIFPDPNGWCRLELNLSESKAILINRFHRNDTNALFSLLKTFKSIANSQREDFFN